MADPLADLWPASYKGVPFWTEKDEIEGGRRLCVDQFPYVDEPYIEDLGSKVREFKLTIYLVDDTYAADAIALTETFDSPGSGTLVLPVGGPREAWCRCFRRTRERDRAGYIAFEADFVRAGMAAPLVSVGYLAQLAFDAIAAAATVGADYGASLQLVGSPAWVVAGAVAGLQNVAATLDTIRTTASVDPVASLKIGAQLADLYNAIPGAASNLSGLDPSVLTSIFSIAGALANAIPASQALDAFAAAVDDVPTPAAATTTANQAAATANAQAVARIERLALLSAYLAAVLAATFDSRPAGIAAKVRLVYRFDRELSLCVGAPDEALYGALQDMRNAGVAYLTQLITTLAPVITVQTARSLPVLALAWTLYKDPLRAAELVARNDVRHPSFMPQKFEALSPSN